MTKQRKSPELVQKTLYIQLDSGEVKRLRLYFCPFHKHFTSKKAALRGYYLTKQQHEKIK